MRQDYSGASKWLRKAADQGKAEGQFSLRNNYLYGLGVQRSLSKAIEFPTLTTNQECEPSKKLLCTAPLGARVPLEGLKAKPEMNGPKAWCNRSTKPRAAMQENTNAAHALRRAREPALEETCIITCGRIADAAPLVTASASRACTARTT